MCIKRKQMATRNTTALIGIQSLFSVGKVNGLASTNLTVHNKENGIWLPILESPKHKIHEDQKTSDTDKQN